VRFVHAGESEGGGDNGNGNISNDGSKKESWENA